MSPGSSDRVNPSRRRLLLAAGLVAAGVPWPGLWRAMAAPPEDANPDSPVLPPGSAKGRDVLILGAGIAGLTSAYELHRAGARVRVLEARERVGGRCWTLRGGDRFTEMGGVEQTCPFPPGDYLNPGANRILPWQKGVLSYCHRLGVPLELYASGPMGNNWVLRRTPGHPLTGRPIRFQELDRDEIGYAMQRLVELLGPAGGTMSSDRDLANWARAYGDLDSEGIYQADAARGYRIPPGAVDAPGEIGTPWPAEQLWSYGTLNKTPARVNSATFPTPTLTVPGGIDRIALALAEQLPADSIRLGAEVVSLRQDATGVRVTWRDRASGALNEERASQVICTIPFILLARIDTDIDPNLKAIIANLAYAPVVKVGLAFGRRFWEQDDHIFGGYSFMDDPELMVIYPSARLGSSTGVVTCYYLTEGSLTMTGLTPQERQRVALGDVNQLHPQAGDACTGAVSVAWARIPFNAGCYGAWSGNARKHDLPRIAEGDRRLIFAGEHISQVPAWMEGAVQSAHAGLQRLQKQWGQGL